MIPDIYATDICSLLENTFRKCISVIYRFSHNYELLDFDIKLTNVFIIKNLSYDDAELYIKKKKTNYSYLLNFLARRFAPKESPDTHPSRRAVGRPPY